MKDLESFNAESGSVLLMKGTWDSDQIWAVLDHLKKSGKKEIMAIRVRDDADIVTMDEAKLAEMGLRRTA